MAVIFFRVRRGCSCQTQERRQGCKEWMSDKIHHSLSQCNTAWKEPHKYAWHVSRICGSYIFYIHEFELLWWFQVMSLKSGWQYNSHRETEQFRTVPAIITYSLYSNMKITKSFFTRKCLHDASRGEVLKCKDDILKSADRFFFFHEGTKRLQLLSLMFSPGV